MLTWKFNIVHNNIYMDSGYCYKFKYANFENDPYPHVLFLYKVSGTHPTSGNLWNLIQCINLNYLPRQQRKVFVNDWMDVLKRTRSKDFRLAWDFVKTRFPALTIATRRYYLTPATYIQKLEYIAPERMEEELIRNYYKDFSMAAFRAKGRQYRKTHPRPGKRM